MSFSWKSKPSNDPSIDLVLSASGSRAPCFIGGIAALKEKGYKIERVGGSSGGAIIAAAYALGTDLDTLRNKALKTPYTKFKDFKVKNLLSLRNPSVYSGKGLDNYLQELFGETTLSDFKIDCRIAVVTILGRKRELLTRDTHPNLPIWKAVRMSSTIPFIFPYYELDGIPVTDGGLITSAFDFFPDSPRPVLALRPRADHNLKRHIQDVKANTMVLWNYIKIVSEYFLDAADNQHVPEKEWHRTIVIPTFEIGGFNFSLDADKVRKLIQCGYDEVLLSDIAPYID